MASVVDENNFAIEVLNASAPVLVNFWAPWCGLCRLVSPILDRVQSESNQTLKLVSINADENLRLANQYRLTSLPTIIVFYNGHIVYRLDEFKNHDELRNALTELQAGLMERFSLSSLGYLA